MFINDLFNEADEMNTPEFRKALLAVKNLAAQNPPVDLKRLRQRMDAAERAEQAREKRKQERRAGVEEDSWHDGSNDWSGENNQWTNENSNNPMPVDSASAIPGRVREQQINELDLFDKQKTYFKMGNGQWIVANYRNLGSMSGPAYDQQFFRSLQWLDPSVSQALGLDSKLVNKGPNVRNLYDFTDADALEHGNVNLDLVKAVQDWVVKNPPTKAVPSQQLAQRQQPNVVEGTGVFNIGDQVLYKGQPAEVIAVDGTAATVYVPNWKAVPGMVDDKMEVDPASKFLDPMEPGVAEAGEPDMPSRRGFLKKAVGTTAGAAVVASGPQITALVTNFAKEVGGMSGIQALNAMLKIATAREIYDMYDYYTDSGIMSDAITEDEFEALENSGWAQRPDVQAWLADNRDPDSDGDWDWTDFERWCDDAEIDYDDAFEQVTGQKLKLTQVNDILANTRGLEYHELEEYFEAYPEALEFIDPYSEATPTLQKLENIDVAAKSANLPKPILTAANAISGLVRQIFKSAGKPLTAPQLPQQAKSTQALPAPTKPEFEIPANQKQKVKVPVAENYWHKLQAERNTRINSLITELTESIKDIK